MDRTLSARARPVVADTYLHTLDCQQFLEVSYQHLFSIYQIKHSLIIMYYHSVYHIFQLLYLHLHSTIQTVGVAITFSSVFVLFFCLFACVFLSVREGFRKKIRIFYGLLPNRGAGGQRG